MRDPLQTIDFSRRSNKLIPAVVQDFTTQKILTLGFMDEASLKETQQTGMVTFCGKPAKKGGSARPAPRMQLRQILVDCDRDALLIKAVPEGAVCDTGADTCWSEKNHKEDFLAYLEQIISLRRSSTDETSYVRELFSAGTVTISERLNTASQELADASKDVKQALFLEKATDLLFHYIVLLQAKNCTLNDVVQVLQKRHQSR
ncbi:MAG TPA: phosphoribosyl-ATP diphosphatase [Flavisolibacter sp.]